MPERIPSATVAAAVNRAMLYLVALTVVAAVFVASFYPRLLFLPTVGSSLTICAIASAMIAFVRLQSPAASHFTLWDVSTILIFIALGSRLLGDPSAIDAFTQENSGPETTPVAGDGMQPPAPRLKTSEVIR